MLSHTVCGVLLCQPEQITTHGISFKTPTNVARYHHFQFTDEETKVLRTAQITCFLSGAVGSRMQFFCSIVIPFHYRRVDLFIIIIAHLLASTREILMKS